MRKQGHSRLSSDRGNVYLAVVVILFFTAVMSIILSDVASMTSLTSLLIDQHEISRAKRSWMSAVLAEAITEISTNGTMDMVGTHGNVRIKRVSDLLSVSSGVAAPGYSISSQRWSSLATTPLSKANILHDPSLNGEGVFNPLAGRYGFNHTQTSTALLGVSSRAGSTQVSATLSFREVPISEFGWICVEPFNPSVLQVPISVTGSAYMMNGCNASLPGSGSLVTSLLLTPSFTSGASVIATKVYSTPLCISSLMVPDPTLLCASQNFLPPISYQDLFDSSAMVVSLQNGVLSGVGAMPGIVATHFPTSSDPIRVVVTLNSLVGIGCRLYVNCLTTADRAAGIVVVGDNGVPAGSSRIVATNGAIWLWKRNVQPAVVASPYGQIVLTDETWTQAGGSSSSLVLNWAGSIISPSRTEIDTPQLGGVNSQMILTGSLFSGLLTGNLKLLAIHESQNSTNTYNVPRLLMVTGVH